MANKCGTVPKNKEILDGFNLDKKGNLTPAALRKLQMEQMRIRKEAGKTEKELEKLKGQAGSSGVENVETEARSAFQMLQDMRFAYKNSTDGSGKKGRQRLVELMSSDSEFKFMVKELMKIESQLKQAELRRASEVKEAAGGVQNFFVVLKGLESEKQILDMVEGVDVKQISHALNPDGTEYAEKEGG